MVDLILLALSHRPRAPPAATDQNKSGSSLLFSLFSLGFLKCLLDVRNENCFVFDDVTVQIEPNRSRRTLKFRFLNPDKIFFFEKYST